MNRSRFKHIFKLILLGPQPKDELYEEWSKDPLAEWFREQRTSRSWLQARTWRRHFGDKWWFIIPTWAYLFAYFLLPRDLLVIFIIPLIISIFALSRQNWKSKDTGHRPQGSIHDLFFPKIRVTVLSDLWSTGFRGRDVARVAYVQRYGGGDTEVIVAMFCIVTSVVISMSVEQNYWQLALMWVLVVWSSNHCARYRLYSGRNPFSSGWGMLSREFPALRAMKGSDMWRDDYIPNKWALPMWPMFASPLIIAALRLGVFEGKLSPLVVAVALPALVLFSVALMHLFVRGRRFENMPHLEEAFAAADRDFDLWVRTELIGDEDARR